LKNSLPRIKHITTTLPPYCYSSSEIKAYTNKWLVHNDFLYERAERLIESSCIRKRYFASPLEKMLVPSSIEEKVKIFNEYGLKLAHQAVTQLLEETRIDSLSIDTLIFTSCSVPTIPALDVLLLNRLNLSLSIRRIPLYQHGCIGGSVALSLASHFKRALIVCLELCSLMFFPDDFGSGNLLGAVLFGDGCAAALVENEADTNSNSSVRDDSGLTLLTSQSFLIPESDHLMGFELKGDGAHLLLNKAIPQTLSAAVPLKIKEFLECHMLQKEDIKEWFIHPGGAKILNNLMDHFGLSKDQCHYSWDILKEFGNMSSASLLFVLKSFLNAQKKLFQHNETVNMQKVKGLIIGIGPGLTIEIILVEFFL
jgi:alkylresorcinol/alkylpyrone synthase